MFILKFLQKIKSFFYKNFISVNKPICGKKVRIKQPTLFMGKGKIILHDRVQIGYFPSAQFFSSDSFIEAMFSNSKIEIGKNTIINNSCTIVTDMVDIEIGENCKIGTNFKCYSSDFHGLKVEDRENLDKVMAKSVKIGNNVFIGDNVIILKGVTIADGSVIGAGSVVTKSFNEENTILAGNPARKIK